MKTRNADTPKSGKKTPAAKKDAAAPAADKTPDAAPAATKSPDAAAAATKSPDAAAAPATKPATKSVSGKAAKKTTPKATPVASTPDPSSEAKGEEAASPAVEKKTASAAKKPGAKVKSPVRGKAPATPKVDTTKLEDPAPVVVEAEESMDDLKDSEAKGEAASVTDESKDDLKDAEAKGEAAAMAEDVQEGEPTMTEDGAPADEEEPMEEDVEHEGGDEPAGAEEEVGGGEGEGEEAADGEEEQEEEQEEEGAQVEEEERIQISDMAEARKMKKEQEIFVGGLDRDAVEEDLKKAFEKVGEVVEVRLHRDFVTNKNKGFAFVKFANKEQAAKALAELKNPVIRGKRCGIAPSEDNDTLFLGNICNTWTKEAIKRKLKDYGIDNVESVTLVADTQNEGLSRGFAFVEFSCHADATLAYKRLQKPDVVFGHPERTAKVAFAEPIREPDPEVMAQVKSVFIDGLPPHWDEDRVKEQFKGYGEIERIVLARNMSSARRKDFGFVNFTTHEAAVACVEGVNNTELGDGKSKAKARARLANPLPKTQAVKGGMSGGFRIGYSGIGVYSRFGRGFGRGRFVSNRAGFQGGRGFYAGFQGGRGFNVRGRGRGGRFPFIADDIESSYSGFRGRRPFGVRGGGRAITSARGGGFVRGRGRAFPPRRQPFLQEEEYVEAFDARHDPYFYGDGGHGVKRPFSMLEHDPFYMEPGSRLRPRYEQPEPFPGHYRGSLGMTGLYSNDYYGSEYGGSSYSSPYGPESTGGGYYY